MERFDILFCCRHHLPKIVDSVRDPGASLGVPFPKASHGPYLRSVLKGLYAKFLHVVSSEQPSLRNTGNSGITGSDPLSEMSGLPSHYFPCRNHQRRESDECQQKDDLPMDRERTRDDLSNRERPTTHLLQFAVRRHGCWR